MASWCKNCGKVMKHSELTHCSDECLLIGVKNSKSLNYEGKSAENWGEQSDPWI